MQNYVYVKIYIGQQMNERSFDQPRYSQINFWFDGNS